MVVFFYFWVIYFLFFLGWFIYIYGKINEDYIVIEVFKNRKKIY